jgi:hypothetical protein
MKSFLKDFNDNFWKYMVVIILIIMLVFSIKWTNCLCSLSDSAIKFFDRNGPNEHFANIIEDLTVTDARKDVEKAEKNLVKEKAELKLAVAKRNKKEDVEKAKKEGSRNVEEAKKKVQNTGSDLNKKFGSMFEKEIADEKSTASKATAAASKATADTESATLNAANAGASKATAAASNATAAASKATADTESSTLNAANAAASKATVAELESFTSKVRTCEIKSPNNIVAGYMNSIDHDINNACNHPNPNECSLVKSSVTGGVQYIESKSLRKSHGEFSGVTEWTKQTA